eukprot:TRINITY_DN1530_c0_g2_i1.p1 TRINITY_DN1530_c0_g2~~TRINITY_DN1530_c0_g2_i1.p1  ORF type:complete len:307 (-),score=53.98 TRINITY_DN1530_c0_g2_i1:102-1022(-)
MRLFSKLSRPYVPRSISRTLTTSSVKTVGIIGAGQMGTGIAKVAAHTANLKVVLMDVKPDFLKKSVQFIDKLIAKDVEKGKATKEESEKVKASISTTTELKGLSDVDYIIEAATEDPTLKLNLFRDLSNITRPEVILATNTSSISITKIAAASSKPDKVIGMHFFNPVPVMQLVEIISGLTTSTETKQTALELSKAMGKDPIEAGDFPGFIVNRLLVPYLNEAAQALFEGLGTKEDIDKGLKLGCNMPMGPLTLMDFVGLDTVLAAIRVLQGEFGDKYKPCPLLIKYVEAGWLGKKSGRGFYDYSK